MSWLFQYIKQVCIGIYIYCQYFVFSLFAWLLACMYAFCFITLKQKIACGLQSSGLVLCYYYWNILFRIILSR